MNTHDLTSQAGCTRFVTHQRLTARRIAGILDDTVRRQRTCLRTAENLRSNDRFGNARADKLEATADACEELARECSEYLVSIGATLFHADQFINAAVPRELMFDLLNVNPVDRPQLPADAGFIDTVFAFQLEDSAENRNSDFAKGPLLRAAHAYFFRELLNNKKLKQSGNKMLFGAGGMFEHLPRYQQQPDGSMKRLPPSLRVVASNPGLGAA